MRGLTCCHAANRKTCGRKAAAMAVEAVTAHSCATNRSIGAALGRTQRRPVRQLCAGRSWPLARQRLHRNSAQNISVCHAEFSLASLEFGRRRRWCTSAGLRLLDQVREQVRYLHHSIRTKQAHVHGCGPISGSRGCGTTADGGRRSAATGRRCPTAPCSPAMPAYARRSTGRLSRPQISASTAPKCMACLAWSTCSASSHPG